MAVFKRKCANYVIWINDHDHSVPHCEVIIRGRKVRFNLRTLEPFWDRGIKIPAKLRRCLRGHQEEMLRAWERVTLSDPERWADRNQ